MDSKALVESDIELGRLVLHRLQDAGIAVRGASWLYFPDAEEWRLVIVTPLADRIGGLKAYGRVDRVLRAHGLAEHLSTSRLTVVGARDAHAERLGIRLPRPAPASDIRSGDAYIYSLMRPAAFALNLAGTTGDPTIFIKWFSPGDVVKVEPANLTGAIVTFKLRGGGTAELHVTQTPEEVKRRIVASTRSRGARAHAAST